MGPEALMAVTPWRSLQSISESKTKLTRVREDGIASWNSKEGRVPTVNCSGVTEERESAVAGPGMTSMVTRLCSTQLAPESTV